MWLRIDGTRTHARKWDPSSQPAWLTADVYSERIQAARHDIDFNDRLRDRGIALVRGAHPPWQPPASEALAGAGRTRESFADLQVRFGQSN